MPQINRRIVNEAYDPKQRIVGGIVLFLLVLLVYLILKLFINLVAVSDNTTLQEILQARRAADPTAQISSNNTDVTGNTGNASTANSSSTLAPRAGLPAGFAFLGLDGEPLDAEMRLTTANNNTGGTNANFADTASSGEWYVQVASFREESRAERLAEQIKDKGLAEIAYILPTEIQGRTWYVVQLPTHTTRQAAAQQRRRVNNALSVQSILKQVN